MANEKKYPLTIIGLYKTATEGNSRSAVLTQERADQACAAIQAAVGGKISVKRLSLDSRAKFKNQETAPDYFLEAVTPEILAEERARMQAKNDGDASL